MIRYAFDLYPRTDPRDGARVIRFSKLQPGGSGGGTSYRGDANGTGAGSLLLRGTSTDADSIDPAGLQYVRVVRIDTDTVDVATDSGFDELVVGGIWLEAGDFEALTENSTKKLTFGGAGTLAYLDREVMWSHTYIGAAGELSSIAGGQDPFDDRWRLYGQGAMAGGDHLGAVLYRVIAEGLSYQDGAYTHKHGDGLVYTDTHDDDRTSSAIGDLVLTFDGFTDSDGNAWTLPSGNFEAQIGESLLSVAKRVMEAGLYIEMDPDTFELRAWEADNHGRDATGLAWGADVVRFQSPTDATVATGNIKSDAKRAIAAKIRRSVILAGGQDVYGVAGTETDVPWHGFYPSDVEDVDALTQVAQTQVDARDDAGDTVRLRMKLARDAAHGKYVPFETVLLDDLATIHTGTGQWDWNEASSPVAALTVSLRPGGDWDAFADLGSSYMDSSSRIFQTKVNGKPIGPTLRLCDPARSACTDVAATLAPHFIDGTTTDWGVGGNLSGFSATGGGHNGANTAGTASGLDINCFIEYGFTGTFTAGKTYKLRQWIEAVNFSNTVPYAFGVGAATGSAGPPGTPSDGVSGSIVLAAGVEQLLEIEWTPTADATGVSVRYGGVSGDVGLLIVSAGSLEECGTSNPLNGTSNQAARCDKSEHEILARDPTVDDDEDHGYPRRTIWHNSASGATFISTDGSSGAAVWEVVGAAGSPDAADVTFTPAGTIAATSTQAAVEEVATDAAAALTAHTGDATDAHDASAVSVLDTAGNFTGTDVEAVLAELQDSIDGVVAGDANLPWFDVTDPAYGATGDGTTDDTTAVQAAIDAAAAAGGGIVFFPAGVYLIGGALSGGTVSSQLTLPSVDAGDEEQISIVLRGPQPPPPIMYVVLDTSLPDNQAVIKSTLTTGSGAILGGYDASGYASMTNLYLTLRNLTFRTPTNPTISGLDLRKVAAVDVDNVVVDSSEYHVQDLIEPTTATSFGVRLPGLDNGANTRVGVLNVIGFYKGVEHGEHLNGEQINVWGCKQALVPVESYHASYIARLMTVHCQRGIVPTGRAYVHVDQFNIEHVASGDWFQTVYDIDDASDNLYGSAEWKVTKATVGHDSTFTVNGASNFQYWEMGQTPGGGGSPTGAAGGDLSGTYPNPSVVDDSHNHTAATLPAGMGSLIYLPLTTVVGGVPELVWDADNSLIATGSTP